MSYLCYNVTERNKIGFFLFHVRLGFNDFQDFSCWVERFDATSVKDLSPKVVTNSIEVLLIQHHFAYRPVKGRFIKVVKYIGSEGIVIVYRIWAPILAPFPLQFPPSKSSVVYETERLNKYDN